MSSNGSSNKVYSSYICVLIYLSTKSTVTEAMYTDQQVRGLKKAVFRRLTSKLNMLKALDSKDDAKSVLVELKEAFTAFEEDHDVVCASITDFHEHMLIDKALSSDKPNSHWFEADWLHCKRDALSSNQKVDGSRLTGSTQACHS